MFKRSMLRRSIVSVMLAVILLLAGCATNAPTPSEQSNTNATKAMSGTIKIFMIGETPKGQAEVTKALEKALAKDNLNFKLDFTFITGSEYVNKLTLVASSGEDYDICWTMPVNIGDLAAKKGLAPLNDALKNYGKDLLASIPELSLKEVTFDGNIYGIPTLIPVSSQDGLVQIRKDLREKYGMPPITTVAGFEDYLRAVKANEPGMIPYSDDVARFLCREYGEFFTPIGKELRSPVYVAADDTNMVVKNFYTSDIFKNIAMKIRKWDSEGLYGLEVSKNVNADVGAGKVAATWATVGTLDERISQFKSLMPNGMLENVFLYPDKPHCLFVYGVDNLSVLAVSKKVNESVAFINWIRKNQANYDLMSYGVKDVNYKLKGDSISYEGIVPENVYLPSNWSWADVRFRRYDAALDPGYKESRINWDSGARTFPYTGFVLKQDPINIEIAQMTALMAEYRPQLLNSKIDWQTTLDTFLKKMDEAGMEKVIKECQTQMDAYVKK